MNPYHSHFMFVDNGTQHKFGTELFFREKLEAAVLKYISGTVCI